MTMIPWKMKAHLPTTKYVDPFTSMTRLMDDYFGNVLTAPTWRSLAGLDSEQEERFVPKINVREGENEVAVTAELPGLEPKDVEIFLEDNALTLKGERKYTREGGDKDRHYVESSYGAFQRTMSLPFEADREKIKAQFKDGILKVNLYRSDRAKDTRRKIEIAS